MDNERIEALICEPKSITKPPKKSSSIEGSHERNGFKMKSLDGKNEYSVFMRAHIDFPENFSIGLDYLDPSGKRITIFRCNGNHGEVIDDPITPNVYHFDYHTHKLKAEDLEKNVRALNYKELAEYTDFHGALRYFCHRVNITDASDHFDNLDQATLFEL